MLAWINFICLIVSIILFCYFYTLSIQPKKREQEKGENAWKKCAFFRSIADGLEFIIIINSILWIWFPIPIVGWNIHPNYLFGIFIFLAILIPGMIIMIKGIKDAGSETLQPSDHTEMYGGIYEYIRHPQTLGEFPMLVAFGFLANSWFLVFILIIFIVIYVPIMIYFEEKDLVRRFGEKYKKYQKETGALFPKIRK